MQKNKKSTNIEDIKSQIDDLSTKIEVMFIIILLMWHLLRAVSLLIRI